jgi:CDP-6-deoxy-D-xylo-4-hexulose-3-dehydrase
MNNTFWIGVWPGLTEKMLDYIIEIFHDLFKDKK